MAKRRKPETSKISLVHPVAYARRQKTSGGGADAKEPGETDDKTESKAETADAPGEAREAAETTPPDARATQELSPLEPPPTGEPWPDATPTPMRPVDPGRARTETVGMPAELVIGSPPELPKDPGTVEDPTSLPGPRDVPAGEPTDPAQPPGRVPAGDSRSLRKGNEFALVYRVQTSVISRFGTVGTRGQWRVVEYPTTSSASNAYAKECSRFVSEGFSDYRD